MKLALAAAALLLAQPALADAPETHSDASEVVSDLQWQWKPGETRSFYVESVMLFDRPVFLQGERNLEARATQVELKFITTCTTEEDGKRRWEHECTIDDIGLIGLAFRSKEDEQLRKLMHEFDSALTGASLQIRQRRTGKIVGFDLQGVSKRNRELSWTHEQLRRMLRQSFSGLDLEFTDLATDDIWVQPNTRMTEFVGSLGAVPIAHLVAETADERSVITSFGKGSVGVDTGRYTVRVSGDALWDNSEGVLLYRSWKVMAEARQALNQPIPLANTGWIAILGDHEDRPSVGATGLWSENAVRDTAITLMDVLMSSWTG